MIDYVKFLIVNINIEKLLENPLLDFKVLISTSTGVITEFRESRINFCTIKVYDSGLVFFSGSIHKFWNASQGIKAPNYKDEKSYRGYNGNDFTLNDVWKVRMALCEIFECEPNQMIFKNIEFGANLELSFAPKLFIKGLLFHNGKPFEYRYNRQYSQVEHQRYFLKIYNKGEQYSMNKNILRVEVKINRNKHFSVTGIETFADVNTETLNKASIMLLKHFKKILYYDYTTSKRFLNKNELRLITQYSNINYWLNDLEPRHRDRQKKKLYKITSKHSEFLLSEITRKLREKCVIINRLSETPKCVIINNSSIGLNITQPTLKRCPVTGLDISMQNYKSKTITMVGLKYLYTFNKRTYHKLHLQLFGSMYSGYKLPLEMRIILREVKKRYRNLNTPTEGLLTSAY